MLIVTIPALLWKYWRSGRSCQLWLVWGPSVGRSLGSAGGTSAGVQDQGRLSLTVQFTPFSKDVELESPLFSEICWRECSRLPAAVRGSGHAACQARSIHLCFSLLWHGVLCTGSCLRWFDGPLHLWPAKTGTSAEKLYVYYKIESCLFCEALSLLKNIVSIKPSSLLRHSSSSTSVNVIFQQKINKDSFTYSYFLAVLTLKLSGDLMLFCVKVPAKLLLSAFSPSWFGASLSTLSSPIGARF